MRFARLPVDNSVAEEIAAGRGAHHRRRHRRDRHRRRPSSAADERVVERVRHELEKRRKLLAADGADGDPVVQHDDQYTSLSLALIARQREALLELRDAQRIDDIVLRQVEARLDIEEARTSRTIPAVE